MSSKKFQKDRRNLLAKNTGKRTQEEITNILKNFDLMKDIVNAVNRSKLSSVDLASYILDSEEMSEFSIPAHYPPVCNFSEGLWRVNVTKGKKKLKVILIKELFFSDYPPQDIKEKIAFYSKNKLIHVLNRFKNHLKEYARLYIKSKKQIAVSNQISKTDLNPIEIQELDWEIFPLGDWISKEEIPAKLFDHFRKLQDKGKWGDKTFDKTRIDGIFHKLNPTTYKTGKKKFEGYVVYFFDWTDKVVLECPIYGNATYVISSGKYSWQDIAKNSKWEARTEYSDQVAVVNHNETWIDRLEQNLKYGLK